MPKSIIKSKGHHFEKTRYHIPYYTTSFFINPDGEIEQEGEVVNIQEAGLNHKIANQNHFQWR